MLWETSDVMIYTGWSRQFISTLCSKGTLPFIPGRPNKFVPESVEKAILGMQVGGQYGKRKAKKTQIKKAA